VRVIFFGTPEFAVASLDALQAEHTIELVVAQPDRQQGRGMKLASPAVVNRARTRGLRILQPPKIRNDDFLQELDALRPDVGVVVAYGKILPERLLQIPRFGFLNVHGSLLPLYRGAAPVQRAIEAGESETGVTIMRVDRELDHGPMLEVVRTAIEKDERTPALAKRLSILGAEALSRVLRELEIGGVTEQAQDHSLATYASKIGREEGRVDWKLTARQIYNRFRAFDPWPGLFLESGTDGVLKLTDVHPVHLDQSAPPGVISSTTATTVTFATGEGGLEIRSLQRSGKQPSSAADYVRLRRLKIGDRLE